MPIWEARGRRGRRARSAAPRSSRPPPLPSYHGHQRLVVVVAPNEIVGRVAQRGARVVGLARNVKPLAEIEQRPCELPHGERAREVDLQVVARVVQAALGVGTVGGLVAEVGVRAPRHAVARGEFAGALGLVKEEGEAEDVAIVVAWGGEGWWWWEAGWAPRWSARARGVREGQLAASIRQVRRTRPPPTAHVAAPGAAALVAPPRARPFGPSWWLVCASRNTDAQL